MPATNRQAKKSANRQKLIEATIDSIAELGLTDTTVSTVVARAGLSRGIVHLHFETKEALLAETLRFLCVEWEAAWCADLRRAAPDAASQLQSILLSGFEPPVFNRRRLAAWHAFYADTKYQATYREIAGPADRLYLERMTELCEELIAEGGYEGLDAAMLAKALRAMTDGLCLDWLIAPRSTTRAEARRVCLHVLERSFPRHFPPAPAAAIDAGQSAQEAAA